MPKQMGNTKKEKKRVRKSQTAYFRRATNLGFVFKDDDWDREDTLSVNSDEDYIWTRYPKQKLPQLRPKPGK